MHAKLATSSLFIRDWMVVRMPPNLADRWSVQGWLDH